MATNPTPQRTPNPDPGYRGGTLLTMNIPTREFINGQLVSGTRQVKVLKHAKVRYANPVTPMKSDANRRYAYALTQMKPGRFGCIGITGFDELAPVVANLKPGQVVSAIGDVNYRDGRAFFELEQLIDMNQPSVAEPEPEPPAAAEPPKRSRKTKTAPAAPADDDDIPF